MRFILETSLSNVWMTKICIIICASTLYLMPLKAQSLLDNAQQRFPRVANAFKYKVDSLKKQFKEAGLAWPAKQLYLRSFKQDSQLEVWVRNNKNEQFILFKTYKICALSGSLGPKRKEGDYQVPEGFYYVNELNPNSKFHLSLGLNYPNAADRVNSKVTNPGGEIYIHGTCSTVGCIPLQNDQVEELYVLATLAQKAGQQFIPVHIFPIKFGSEKNNTVLKKAFELHPAYAIFVSRLKEVYDYFESNKKLPLISINKNGDYQLVGR